MVLTLVCAPYLIRVDWEQKSATQNSPQRQADDPTSMLLHFSKQVSSIAKASGKAMLADDKKKRELRRKIWQVRYSLLLSKSLVLAAYWSKPGYVCLRLPVKRLEGSTGEASVSQRRACKVACPSFLVIREPWYHHGFH